VKRGVVAGLDVGSVLGFLEGNSSNPLPANVRYSVKEWAEMLREAGFSDVEAFGGWGASVPAAPDVWRLILRARTGT
jgi:hypothetical protein